MNRPGLPYRITAALGVPLVPILLRDDESRRAHHARLESVAKLVAWGKQRDPAKKLVWFHAASVGEGLQAEAILNAFRERHPEALVIFTHYSPSAVPLAARINADWAGFLPYDRRGDVVRVLDALKPDLLVFTKVDLWPELACQAAVRGCMVALMAATVEPGSSRLHWPARGFAHPGYQSLSIAGAISRGDAERLVLLGCPAERIVVTGDPRIDSVFERMHDSAAEVAWPDFSRGQTLIAGSTWGDDEAVLLEAFAKVRVGHPDAALVIVPHQPSPEHLRALDSVIEQYRLPQAVRLSALSTAATPSLLVVDSVGVLASLYPRASLAYVGGGFGTRGIHSVLEPAAAGCAVVIGPNDRGSRDALLLESANAVVRLTQSGAVSELAAIWHDWLSAPATADERGARGKAALESERGAAERSVALVETELKNDS